MLYITLCNTEVLICRQVYFEFIVFVGHMRYNFIHAIQLYYFCIDWYRLHVKTFQKATKHVEFNVYINIYPYIHYTILLIPGTTVQLYLFIYHFYFVFPNFSYL